MQLNDNADVSEQNNKNINIKLAKISSFIMLNRPISPKEPLYWNR